jgi:opacity protein-like surface antigen
MNVSLKAGLAAVALAIAACTPVIAADLGGSIKDGYGAAPGYAQPAAPVGPCYFRSDVGYSWSRTPDATYVGNVDPTVYGESMSNGGLIEAGLGCAMGSRGFRAEMMLGAREERTFKGHYTDFTPVVPVDPTLTTHVKSYTMMFNAYRDLGKMGGFVPYVGAGIGWAYHKVGDVTSDFNGGCGGCVQFGEDKLSFAWALMAGVGYQISDRAILDIGYRYIDMGLARSSHADSNLGWNPRLEIDDQRAHEIKIGLRYHFGTDCCSAQPVAYAPMK